MFGSVVGDRGGVPVGDLWLYIYNIVHKKNLIMLRVLSLHDSNLTLQSSVDLQGWHMRPDRGRSAPEPGVGCHRPCGTVDIADSPCNLRVWCSLQLWWHQREAQWQQQGAGTVAAPGGLVFKSSAGASGISSNARSASCART